MLIKNYLLELIYLSITNIGLHDHIPKEVVPLERPGDISHGEFATTVSLLLFSKAKKQKLPLLFNSPKELAQALVTEIKKNILVTEQQHWINSVETAGPGFINFSLSDQYYLELLPQFVSPQARLLESPKSAESYFIEYVSPNTNKPLHIGHLRNAALGVSMGNILKTVGAQVTMGTINNDRGLHIIKSVWGYLFFGKKENSTVSNDWKSQLLLWQNSPTDWLYPEDMAEKRLQKPDHFVGNWYLKADSYVEDAGVMQVWSEMLQAWEQKESTEHTVVRSIWKKMNNWFYSGYAETAKTYGFSFDPEGISYESEIYEAGKQVILAGAEKGIFEKLPDGAIKADLSRFKLPDKVMIRKDGTGLYILQDIELLRERITKNFTKISYIVGVDQKLYFQQLFAVAELLGYGNAEKFHHFSYGMVRLPEGKMSSRKGIVIYGDDLITLAQEKAREIMKTSGFATTFSPEEFEHIVHAVGVGAVKWTMLAQDPQSEITFDIAESVNFTGFAGPYVQYTAARAYSVLTKSKISSISIPFDTLMNSKEYSNYQLNSKERDLLVNLSLYFDVVKKSAQEYAPHHLAVYLYSLSQAFNSLYADNKIVSDDPQESVKTSIRIALTQSVRNILAEGLELLGLEPIERM